MAVNGQSTAIKESNGYEKDKQLESKRRKFSSMVKGDRWNDLILNTWIVEFACLTLGICSFISTLVLLWWSDGRKLPHMPYGITLNALLTLLVTLTTTSLMAPVSQGISQLKWIWFAGKGRKISDFEIFDEASRGIYGSIILIVKLKFKNISCLGALVAILIVTANTLTQQSIQYVSTLMEDKQGTALAPRSTQFDPPREFYKGLDLHSVSAIYRGMLEPHKYSSPVPPFCSTGNCTWPDYQSLGVCAEVVDVTSDFPSDYTHSGLGWNAVSSEGTRVHFDGWYGWIVQPVGAKPVEGITGVIQKPDQSLVPSVAFKEVQQVSLVDFFVFVSDQMFRPIRRFEKLRGILAYEVNLHVCIQTIRTNVTNARTHTTVTGKYSNFSYRKNATDDFLTSEFPGTGESFTIGSHVPTYFRNFTNAQLRGAFNSIKFVTGANAYGYNSAAEAILLALSDMPTDSTPEDNIVPALARIADGIAGSLTNRFREAGDARSAAVGTAKSVQTFVQISWPWLCGLAIAVVATVVFLVLVMIVSRQNGSLLWKGSSLATLIALDPRDRPAEWNRLQGLSAIGQQAKSVEANFGKLSGDWKLTAEDSTIKPQFIDK